MLTAKENGKGRKGFLSANGRELGMLLVLVVIAILVQIRSGGAFLTLENMNDLLAETAVLAILSVGMMMVIITTGIDLSIGATMALSAMIATSVMKSQLANGASTAGSFFNTLLIVLIAVAVGTVCGLIIGFLVSRLNILPIIATLGMMNVYRGITYLVSDGSWVMQKDMTDNFKGLATGKFLGLNYLIWIVIVLYIAGFFFLNYTRKGRQIYAVGNDEESARVSGIRTKNVLLLVYTLMGAIAGLAGILYVCKYAVAQGETASGYEMNVIAASVLGGVSIAGGTGKIQGVLLGALLFGVLNNALPLINISAFWQEAIRGVIILASVIANIVLQRRMTRGALERRSLA